MGFAAKGKWHGVKKWGWGRGLAKQPLSSLRTQGPVLRGGNYWVGWSTAFFNNASRWLWVPAFAGTTMDHRSHAEPTRIQLSVSKCLDRIEPRRAP